MRLVIFEPPAPLRQNFHPLSLSRPIWELRCGITSLGEKLAARFEAADVAGFVPEYMAPACRARSGWKINDPAALAGDDLLLVDARVKAHECPRLTSGESRVYCNSDGDMLLARITREDRARLPGNNLAELLSAAKQTLPVAPERPATWNYIWELLLANPEQIRRDFAVAGRRGIEGRVEQPSALRGSAGDVYVAPGAVVHPLVVIDAEHGPVYLDEGVQVHPFTRIEGPCYVGPHSILLGAKCREGNSIGPMCRIGGEVEESIVQGYSNKYHDGFLGHAYVGQWVNLGALTTNSDLKNDYSNVSVVLDGQTAISTASTKIGSLIGDHTKTSIGTLLNTGAYLGAMCLVLTSGRLLPKFVPSFCWHLDGALSAGKGKRSLYDTARRAMRRRQCEWTAADETMWDAIHDLTAAQRARAMGGK
jgi:UDP-N-acetylglucosamine diphosphorylase/glucosamine-1-phosphate N-acetyltransferase